MDTIEAALRSTELSAGFRPALIVAVAAAAIGLIAGLATRWSVPPGGAIVALTVGAVAGGASTGLLSSTLRALTVLVAALACTVVIATRRRDERRRAQVAQAAVAVGGAAALWACVPETERALIVLGATLGVAVVAPLVSWRGTEWVLAGLLVVVAHHDGLRLGAVVAGWLLAGLVAGGSWWCRRQVRADHLAVGLGALAVVGVFVSRVVGLSDQPVVVLPGSLATVAAVTLAWRMVSRRDHPLSATSRA